MEHDLIKNITNDIYNNFYLKVKDLDRSDESEKEKNRLSHEIAAKYGNNYFCQNLLVQYQDAMDGDIRRYVPARKERKT